MPREGYDEYLSGILLEEKSIVGFLHTIFDFLARRTDFYYVSKGSNERMGFPTGMAQDIVIQVMNDCNPSQHHSVESNDHAPDVVAEEVEVETENVADEDNKNKLAAEMQKMSVPKGEKKYIPKNSESYNGADRDLYAWSQTIVELEVTIRLPPDIKSSKNVKVSTTCNALHVETSTNRVDWTTLVKDTFPYNIKHSETVWTMSEGGILRINLEKQQERWWKHLLSNEPVIDVSKIDCSRPLHELPEDHVSKVRELQWNRMQEMKNLPTSDESKQIEMLRQSWDAEGSPFKGTPFNPGVLKQT